MTDRIENPQIACRITATTHATHAIIRANLHRSAVYGGRISGRGPRYCPSIEDKVVRFADRDRHTIFLEPEGLDDDHVYPNGISTSLPEDVQRAVLATIPGLERAAHDAARLRGRVRLYRSAFALDASPGAEGVCQACSWRGRSTARRATRRRRRRVCWPGSTQRDALPGSRSGSLGSRPGLYRRADRRSHDAGRQRAVPDVHLPGRIPPYLRADNADLRLTPAGMAWGCVRAERAAAFAAFAAEVARGAGAGEAEGACTRRPQKAGLQRRRDGRGQSVLDAMAAQEESRPRLLAASLARRPARPGAEAALSGSLLRRLFAAAGGGHSVLRRDEAVSLAGVRFDEVGGSLASFGTAFVDRTAYSERSQPHSRHDSRPRSRSSPPMLRGRTPGERFT